MATPRERLEELRALETQQAAVVSPRERLEELREIHVNSKWKELSDQAILELIDGALEMVDVAELDMRLTKTPIILSIGLLPGHNAKAYCLKLIFSFCLFYHILYVTYT